MDKKEQNNTPTLDERFDANVEKVMNRLDEIQITSVSGRITETVGLLIKAIIPHVKIGRPEFDRISTSHVECCNLSVRMHIRRFAKMTNAFTRNGKT